MQQLHSVREISFNTLNAELNPICHLLALLGAHHIFHVSGVRVKSSQVAVLIARTISLLGVSLV
jgi:hypothetical protein